MIAQLSTIKNFNRIATLLLFLGRVALGAQRPIVIKLSVGRSVQCIVLKREADPDAIWDHKTDRSRDEAGTAIWGWVHGKRYF